MGEPDTATGGDLAATEPHNRRRASERAGLALKEA